MTRVITGIVLSNKMEKTVIVSVEKRFQHPTYRKIVIKTKKYKVHCENKDIKPGDEVIIQETNPISRHKHFTLKEKIGEGKTIPPIAEYKKVKVQQVVVKQAEAKPTNIKSVTKTKKPKVEKKAKV